MSAYQQTKIVEYANKITLKELNPKIKHRKLIEMKKKSNRIQYNNIKWKIRKTMSQNGGWGISAKINPQLMLSPSFNN